MNVTTPSPFQSDILEALTQTYSNWHGYISLVLCAFGIPMNIINIVVLTRKNMVTPINCILTWLAVADIATMLSYVPFAYHFYCQHSSNSISPLKNSWGWMQFLLVYLNFSATTHTISIWLAVAIAMFRHHHIHSPSKGNLTHIRRLVRARVVVGVIVCCSVIIMVPNYLSHRLEEMKISNMSLYVFEDWKLGSHEVKPIKMIALLLYSILAKVVPCILIIVYGGLLLRMIHKSAQQQKRLSVGKANQVSNRNTETSRTTVMLLIVIVLFLITELPQGVLILCSIFIKKFFEKVYIPLGDMMDIVALLNNSINFVLYCTMSQEFRRTFIRLFVSRIPSEQGHSHYYTSMSIRDNGNTKVSVV